MRWHIELYYSQNTDVALQQMKQECYPPCHFKKYWVANKVKKHKDTLRNQRSSSFTIRLEDRAMTYQIINERKAITVDQLFANIGGTLGLYLGVSGFTGLTLIQYIIRKVHKLCRKKAGNVEISP